MKTNIYTALFLGVLALIGSARVLAADPGLYKHVVEMYPGDLESCNADLSALAARFEQLNGVKVYGAYCLAKVNGRSIEISYVAEHPLKVIRLEDRSIYAGRLGYPTREACDQMVEKEMAIFSQETGLEPFLGYCQFDEERFNDVYTPYIEAFGDAIRRPYLYTTLFARTPAEDIQGFMARVKAKNHLGPAKVSFVEFYKDFAGLYIRLNYYNEAKLNLDIKEVIGFDSFQECNQERIRLEGLMDANTSSLDGNPLFLFCSINWEKKFFLESFQSLSGEVFKPVIAPDVFTAKEACLAKQAEIVRFYQEDLNKEVAGAVCGKKDQSFRLAIFVR